MTTLPTWAVYVVSFGTPVMTFLGVMLAQFLGRRGATELDRRSRREEGLRMFRWAADHAASGDRRLVALGTSTIQGLHGSAWFEVDDRVFIDNFLDSILRELRGATTDLSDNVVFVLSDE